MKQKSISPCGWIIKVTTTRTPRTGNQYGRRGKREDHGIVLRETQYWGFLGVVKQAFGYQYPKQYNFTTDSFKNSSTPMWPPAKKAMHFVDEHHGPLINTNKVLERRDEAETSKAQTTCPRDRKG